MKFASLKYDNSNNIGDEIQSLAAAQHLPQIDGWFDRDSLRTVERRDPHLLIFNGWFSDSPDSCFPPADFIVPVFFGFHITDWNGSLDYFLNVDSIEYLKRHEPIGCRDRRTAEMLVARGVDAFYSRCLTVTFPRRPAAPRKGKVFIVDAEKIPVPRSLAEGAVRVTQLYDREIDLADQETKVGIARRLLDMYREQARLVITTRLHCALPCIAMGIPVVFFGDPEDYRISILSELGLTIHEPPTKQWRRRRHTPLRLVSDWNFARRIDWDPAPLDVEAVKSQMKTRLQEMVGKAMSRSALLDADARVG